MISNDSPVVLYHSLSGLYHSKAVWCSNYRGNDPLWKCSFLWMTHFWDDHNCVAYFSWQLQTALKDMWEQDPPLSAGSLDWPIKWVYQQTPMYIVEWRLWSIVLHWLKKLYHSNYICLGISRPKSTHKKLTISSCLFLFLFPHLKATDVVCLLTGAI